MRLPPTRTESQGAPKGRKIHKPSKDTHLSGRKVTTPASGWVTVCHTSALDPSISSQAHTHIPVEGQTLGTPLLSLSSPR